MLHALWLLVLVKLVTPPLVWLPEPWTAQPAPASRADAPGEWFQRSHRLSGDGRPRLAGGRPRLAGGRRTSRRIPPVWTAVFVPAPEVEAAPPAPTEPPPPPVPAPVAPTVPASPWWVAAPSACGWPGRRRGTPLPSSACVLPPSAAPCCPAPESLRQRTQRLAEKMRLRRRPAVWLTPGRLAPMLWAAGGPPRILFPADLLGHTTPEQQNALLVHELAHLRRRDHWVRWLEFVGGRPVLVEPGAVVRPPGAARSRGTLLRRLGHVHAARRRQDLRRRPFGNARLSLRRSARHAVAGERRRSCRRSEKEIDHDYERNDAAGAELARPAGRPRPRRPRCRCCRPGAVQPTPQPKPDAPAKSDEPVLRFRIADATGRPHRKTPTRPGRN